jgi:hypothetical protein
LASQAGFRIFSDTGLPNRLLKSAWETAPGDTATSVLDRPIVWWTSLVLMLGTLLVPLFAVAVPPLTDYPNHLARCYVLAFGHSDPVLQRMFAAHWQVIPNIAIDLILPALMHVFPPLEAGKIMLAFCLLLPTTGTIALGCAYFRKGSFWQLAAGFAAFNGLFLMGFMNFEFAIGIALWGAAGWVRYRETYPTLTVVFGAFVATLVFFFHLTGLFFFALLIGSYELALVLSHGLGTKERRYFAATRALLFAVALAIPLFFYAVSPLGHTNDAPNWPHLGEKASELLVPFLDYSSAFDVLTVVPVIALLIACVLAGHIRVSLAALITCGVLLAAYAVMPRGLKGAYFVDTRLPVMLGFMIFAGFIPRTPSWRRLSVAGVMVFAGLFLIRVGFITRVWIASQRDVSDLREVIAPVTPGSRVLAADVVKGDNPAWFAEMPTGRRLPELTATYWHLASFVLLDRRAFWPTVFASDTQQPIRVQEPYRELQAIDSPPPNYAELATTQIPPSELKRFPFLQDWTDKFDYVLVLNAEGAPNLDNFVPGHLHLLARRGIAALFKVTN